MPSGGVSGHLPPPRAPQEGYFSLGIKREIGTSSLEGWLGSCTAEFMLQEFDISLLLAMNIAFCVLIVHEEIQKQIQFPHFRQ
jgi:hypothetical protein